MSIHYKTDESVRDDVELQAWCREITEIGLLGAQDRGRMSPKTPTCDSSLELPQNLFYFLWNLPEAFPTPMNPPKAFPDSFSSQLEAGLHPVQGEPL